MGGAAGLTTVEARRLLAAEGANTLPDPTARHPLREFAAQLTHMLALLLWVAAGLALLAGMPQLAVAIVVIVVVNAAFAFWQEHRADRSAQRLRSLLPSGVRVVRDGVETTVPAADLARGDLMLLSAGDRVGADARVERATDLRLDESMVTGESQPVEHRARDVLMTGTFVVQGTARAVVTATGSGTALAGISTLAQSAERPPSPLSAQLARVVRVVAIVATATGVALGVGALLMGLDGAEAFLFGVGVTVALVPEGLLPTVTLSLARGARQMADQQALVRRLDAVETLGATTYICTDKTGTLTQNRMQVLTVVTPRGAVQVSGEGYAPVARLDGPAPAVALVADAARAAAACVTGQVLQREGAWVASGDPMEAALDCLARRAGIEDPTAGVVSRRPYSPDTLTSGAVLADGEALLGAPESVIPACAQTDQNGLAEAVAGLTSQGLRVLAVAHRGAGSPDAQGWRLLGLLALEDPPRDGVADSLAACRAAGITVAMLTGDHPHTAEAIARQVGHLTDGGTVLVGGQLPEDDRDLGALLDRPDGVVVARVTPADKFRIARVLRDRGHVVAMTGDGVNDAPALREADVGVAMGASGSDVAREAADLVLLDDHFGTIVTAVRLGRATFLNVRRFLTFHLTDNVSELMPFALWALTGGRFPLAIGVLQVLALDIGTDMLPALALGAEPPRAGILHGRRLGPLVDRALLTRAFLVLGLAEAVASMAAFTGVLLHGGWHWGATPPAALLATASGTAFAAIALGQVANAFACRSTSRPAWRMSPFGNRLVLAAVAAELVLLVAFLGLPTVSALLGGTWPSPWGWLVAAGAPIAVLLADGLGKWFGRRR